ncbi:hypothetical protein DXG01_003990 [Tephrocybe rancida]|nr:hypothetical protein DXG01_003990 [Tephrocybe rancida]
MFDDDFSLPVKQPSSDSSLGVRKSHPSTPAPATTVVLKKTKLETTGTRNRPRASDFDSFTKNVVEDAIVGFRTYVSTKNPYPTGDNESRDIAARAWVAACRSRKVEIEFDDDVLKLITARASQTRGQIKTICRSLVETHYRLSLDNNKRVNRDRVEDLLERSAFVFKDPVKRTGMLLHGILPAAIGKMWYKSKTDEGVICAEYSDRENGIPLVTIALVLTAIECCLDEWQSGERQDLAFSVTTYSPKYKSHLRNLQDFQAKTQEANIVPRIRKHLLKTARKHAKVDPMVTSVVRLGDEDFEAAKHEWNNMVLSDEDNE